MSLARGVILGEKKPDGLTILVPRGNEDPLSLLCLVPGCGKAFARGEKEAWQRHCASCAKANLDKIHAAMDRRPALMREDFDPEVSKHMRQVGARMIEEGRLEVKPSERAGHS